MRIVIECSEVGEKRHGISQFVLNVIQHLSHFYPENEHILVPRSPQSRQILINEFSQDNIRIIHDYLEPIGLKRQSQSFLLQRKLREFEPYAFICPSEKWPIAFKHGVMTIHDTRAFHRHVVGLPWLPSLYLRFILRQGLKHASRIITVTKTIQNDLIQIFGNKVSSKITPIYHATDPEASKTINYNKVRGDIQNLAEKHRFFFYYGQIWRPHKNVNHLIEAFNLYCSKKTDEKDIALILSGQHKDSFPTDNPRIFLTDYIDEDERKLLLSHCIALLYPSLYEGFGIPILDAIAHGKPVVCSDLPVFKELFNGAALYVNPQSVSDIANGMHAVMTHYQEAQQRVAQFYAKNAHKFSAKKFADDIIQTLRYKNESL